MFSKGCQVIRKFELLFIFFLVLAAGPGDTVAQDNSAELSRAHQLLDRGKPDEGIALLKEISRREPNRREWRTS